MIAHSKDELQGPPGRFFQKSTSQDKPTPIDPIYNKHILWDSYTMKRQYGFGEDMIILYFGAK